MVNEILIDGTDYRINDIVKDKNGKWRIAKFKDGMIQLTNGKGYIQIDEYTLHNFYKKVEKKNDN